MTAPSQSAGGPVELARRLKALRKDRSIPQRRVADALGVSIALISAWESETNPTVPPGSRIRDLATFYASERSWTGDSARLLTDGELSPAERGARDEIDEVLRSFTSGPSPLPVVGEGPSTLQFPRGEDIRIVCGRLEQPLDDEGKEKGHPYTEPDNVNYTDLLTFADVDALMELFGFLRKVNPDSDIRFLRADRLVSAGSPDDLASHVILLGGLGLNEVTGPMVRDAGLPMRQERDPAVTDQGEIFTLDNGERFVPELTPHALLEDVGLLARAPNPYHSGRTLTVFSGVFSRGVHGAVRTLTDDKLRKSNERQIKDHFAHADRFAILMRVAVRFGKAQTPDLQNARTRLYEWPEDSSGREMAG